MNRSFFSRRISQTILLSVCLAFTGCSPTLDTRYATTRGDSINGIGCFIDLIKQSGRKVDLWPGVSPKMDFQYQTIIVFHSNFDPRSGLVHHDLREISTVNGNLRIIVVVRDSDTEVDYWRQIKERTDLTPQQLTAASKSYHSASTDLAMQAATSFEPDNKLGYGIAHANRIQDAYNKTISCESEDETKTIEARWPLNRRLVPLESSEILWHSGDDPLLIKEETQMGELLILASANPLLNGGLVDKGNRQLAEELIEMIPKSDRVAIATSSRWIDHPDLRSPSVMNMFNVHPNGWVFSEAIAALFLFCWWKFPIFGRPRVALNIETARFSRHVEAFGRLLRRTQDTKYARQRIRDWQENTRRQSD